MDRSDWRSMETAPKDGTVILGYGKPSGLTIFQEHEKDSIGIVYFNGVWLSHPANYYEIEWELKFWMPLPRIPPQFDKENDYRMNLSGEWIPIKGADDER